MSRPSHPPIKRQDHHSESGPLLAAAPRWIRLTRLSRAASGNEDPVAAQLEIAPLPNGAGFSLAGDLDFSTTSLFTEAVCALPSGDELQLELTELILVDSAGLYALLGLARSRGDRSLILVNPRASVMRSFEIASFDQHPAIEIRDAGAQTGASAKSSPLRRAG